ncbi:hypothetical protein [Pedobacter jeongneungensis]|uniref:hypothetical protein n=1 Tax=Pedobacter jeongneungensis TaxID=947309 RepID=UPI0004A7B0A6|nr:hypothetical protein [Pedobacter jeongneungensis]
MPVSIEVMAIIPDHPPKFFIYEGVRHEVTKADGQIKNAIQSLVVMEARYNESFDWINSDLVNDIMNSCRGHIYDAMAACSIREVKVKGGEPFWDEKVKKCIHSKAHRKVG